MQLKERFLKKEVCIDYNNNDLDSLKNVLKTLFPLEGYIAKGDSRYYSCLDFKTWESNSILPDDIIPIPIEEFVKELLITDKWCLKLTEDNLEIVRNWLVENDPFKNSWNFLKNIIGDKYVTCKFKWSYNIASYLESQEYRFITFDLFKKYILTKNDTMSKQTLKRRELIKAYNKFTCSDWKSSIQRLLIDNLLVSDDDIEIPKYVIDKLVREGNLAMTDYVSKLGIRLYEFPKDGTPCLVKNGHEWSLRYANGKGEFYNYGRTSGHATLWETWQILDTNNLPIND